MKENPEYELKLVDRTLKTNDDQIINEIQENLLITYKYYEIAFNNEKINSVNTIEEAEELIKQIKDDNEEKELDLSIIEKYTQNEDEVNTTKIEVAKQESEEMIKEKIEKQKEEKEEELMPEVNGIKLALKPISGTITSRYGESSSLRKSTHTGLDIAATTGTPIKVVADGIVTNASYSGSYGNLVKISHGDGVETWYAHTSKMYVTVGQKVSAGDTIARLDQQEIQQELIYILKSELMVTMLIHKNIYIINNNKNKSYFSMVCFLNAFCKLLYKNNSVSYNNLPIFVKDN